MATHAPTTGAHIRAPITLSTILRFCEDNAIPLTRFGRLAVGDPRLVTDMQNGREPTPRISERVRAYIAGEIAPATKPKPKPKSKPKPRRRESVSFDMTDERRHRQAMIRGSAKLLAAIKRARGEV